MPRQSPDAKQIERKERASAALQLLESQQFQDAARWAREKALASLRAAKTPDEAWHARSLLVGSDELLGVLHTFIRDGRNVALELSQAEAAARGAELQTREAEFLEQYKRDARAARKAAEKQGLSTREKQH